MVSSFGWFIKQLGYLLVITTEQCFKYIHNVCNYIIFYIYFIIYNNYMWDICTYITYIVYTMYIYLTYNCICYTHVQVKLFLRGHILSIQLEKHNQYLNKYFNLIYARNIWKMSCYSNVNDNHKNAQIHINNSIMIWTTMCQYFKKCCFTIPRQSL